jgi:RND family efflux transporter MFP subunit
MHIPSCRRLVLVLIGLSLGLMPLACGKATSTQENEVHAAPVKAVAPQMEVLGAWTELLGSTQPLPGHVARVSAAVGGQVLSVLDSGKGPALVEGQQVAKGQVLVHLDDRIARANLDKAKAALIELDPQALQAKIAIDLAKLEQRRLEKLQKSPPIMPTGSEPLVAPIELERARLAVKDAESKHRLVLDKQKTAAAEVKALEEQLALYTVCAPIAGRLGILRVSPGQVLSAGTPVAEIYDLTEVDVYCFAPPDLVGRLALPQPARLAPEKDQSPPQSASGKVCYIAVQAETESGNFAVKVRFPNPGLALRAGRVQRVQVLTKPADRLLVIPEAALQEDQNPPLVVVVQHIEMKKNEEGKEEKYGKARRLQAALGVRERGRGVQLLGLTDPQTHKDVPINGLLFITEGGNGLQNDDLVRIEEPEHEEKGP